MRGASDTPGRYSLLAVEPLRAHGHRVLPVNPALESAAGLPVVRSVADLPAVDTLTLYVGAARLPAMADAIVRLRPGRVIFNPGTESPELQAALDEAGIPWLDGCTLVMLRTGSSEPLTPTVSPILDAHGSVPLPHPRRIRGYLGLLALESMRWGFCGQ